MHPRTIHLTAAVALAAATALGSAAGAETRATGSFRMGETRAAFSHGCAFRVWGDEPGALRTMVILADRALDCAAGETALDPESGVTDPVREADGAYVRLVIGSDGSDQGLYFYNAEPLESFSTSGNGELKVGDAAAPRSTGTMKTAAPQEFFDETFEYDLSWSLDVSDGPVRGSALPAGGGEAGAALVAYAKAMKADDRKALKGLMTAQRSQETFGDEDGSWFAEMWKMRREWELSEATVEGGTLDGDRATLRITGRNGAGEKVRGLVRMVREEGSWRYQSDKLTTVWE
jgi:hypothetical protein